MTAPDREREALLDLFDRYVDALMQGGIENDGKVGHSFVSTYEDAFDYLGLPDDACEVTAAEWTAAVEAKRATLARAPAPASGAEAAAMREACARLCDDLYAKLAMGNPYREAARMCAIAIRAAAPGPNAARGGA